MATIVTPRTEGRRFGRKALLALLAVSALLGTFVLGAWTAPATASFFGFDAPQAQSAELPVKVTVVASQPKLSDDGQYDERDLSVTFGGRPLSSKDQVYYQIQSSDHGNDPMALMQHQVLTFPFIRRPQADHLIYRVFVYDDNMQLIGRGEVPLTIAAHDK